MSGPEDQGLLDATQLDLTDKTRANRLESVVWYADLPTVRRSTPDLRGRLQDFMLDLQGFVARPPPATQLIKAQIAAVAVWETVGALGVPEFTVNEARATPSSSRISG